MKQSDESHDWWTKESLQFFHRHVPSGDKTRLAGKCPICNMSFRLKLPFFMGSFPWWLLNGTHIAIWVSPPQVFTHLWSNQTKLPRRRWEDLNMRCCAFGRPKKTPSTFTDVAINYTKSRVVLAMGFLKGWLHERMASSLENEIILNLNHTYYVHIMYIYIHNIYIYIYISFIIYHVSYIIYHICICSSYVNRYL